MAILTSTVPQSLEEWVTEVYYGSYRDRRQSTIFDRINRMETSVRAFEEKWYTSGVGTYFQKGEGAAVLFDDVVQGARVRITMLTFALGIRVTMESREDDRWEVIEKLPADLADSGMDHMERLGHDVWNNAFATTKYTAIDGSAYCAAARAAALKSGLVRSNAGTGDLTIANFEAALIQMMLLTDENGRFIPMNPDTILVHSSKIYTVQRILESQLEPFTTDNQINTMQSSRTGIQCVASPYLTSTDNWWLFDSKLLDAKFYKRKGMTPNTSTDDVTFDMKLTSHYRANVGPWNWESTYGQQPS